MARQHLNLQAVTTQDITGSCIKTVPTGTKFTITWIDMSEYHRDNDNRFSASYSMCKGIGITSIYNNEFKLA